MLNARLSVLSKDSVRFIPGAAYSAAVLTILFCTSGTVQAADEVLPLEEIIVTARLRSEGLQDVPISETVFTAQTIDDANIKSPGDFIALTPNVTLVESQSAGISFLSIRGITQVRNAESPVAVVVDDVLQINSRQLTRQLFDVERIEVLRGPQGALYGRNATGGAILITTKQPTNSIEGHITAGIGEEEEYSIEGALSGALIKDKLLFRVAGNYLERGGYFNNITLNRKVDFFEEVNFRGMLKWMISDKLTADLRVGITRSEGGSINFQYQPALYGPDGFPTAFDFTIADADQVDRNFYANNLGDNNRDIDEFSLKLNYSGGWGTLTSITSVNRVEEYVGGDQFPYSAATSITPAPPFPFFDGGQNQFTDVDAWSQELRMTSPGDQKFRWMFGAYYLETDRFNSNPTSLDLEQGILRIERQPFFGDPTNPTQTFLADDNDNTASAVFGNIAIDLSDAFEASLALRYDKDQRRQFVSLDNTAGQPGAQNRGTYDKLQPKLTLRYRATENVNIYGSWGEGFRSGQFNANGVGALAEAAGIVGVNDTVGEEITETLEFGVKANLAGGRVRINGAIFDTTVEGQHYFVFVAPVNAQVLLNINEIQLQGFEVEAIASLAEGFDAYLSYGYTDSEIKDYSIDQTTVGNRSPYVPESTFNVGAQYRKAVSQNVGIFVRADYEQRGKQFWDPQNSTARSAIGLLNVRLGLEDLEGKWSLTGTVSNATDEIYNAEYVAQVTEPGLPRAWRIQLRYNF